MKTELLANIMFFCARLIWSSPGGSGHYINLLQIPLLLVNWHDHNIVYKMLQCANDFKLGIK